MKLNIRRIFLLLALLGPCLAWSREMIDLTLEIATAKKGAEAKQEAFEQATEQATRRLTEDLLGAERTAQDWDKIRSRILKYSTRYVLFIKGTPVGETADSTKVSVQMRLSSDNLEALLRETGFFAGGTVRLLPLIQIHEDRGTRYAWWAAEGIEDKHGTLSQNYFKKLFPAMNSQFKNKSVYVLDPGNASFRMGVPSAYRTESLRREDQMLLGQYLKADAILDGRVNIARVRPDGPEYRIDFTLQLFQAKTGQTGRRGNPVGQGTRG
ncbi:MAG: hypothetical protein HC902_12275, partial [Calothrix sp. SM1_5_4]|nr:hypothetical protein [Calothrix sp. SM1_5_4]